MRLGSFTSGVRDVLVTPVPKINGGPVIHEYVHLNTLWDLKRTSASTLVEDLAFEPYSAVDVAFHIKRKSRYHVIQSILPTWLFLCVGYTGFFINRAVAPARITVAIIPVLIMRLLLNGIFSRLQTVSYRIYLTEFLMIAMFISCGCVFQYGLVQVLLQTEADAIQRRQVLNKMANRLVAHNITTDNNGRKQPNDTAGNMMPNQSPCDDVSSEDENRESVFDLDDVVDKAHYDDDNLLRTCSGERPRNYGTKLLPSEPTDRSKYWTTTNDTKVIHPTQELYEPDGYNPIDHGDKAEMKRIFTAFDVNGDGVIDASEVSSLMRHYGIYIDNVCARDTMLNWRYVNRIPIPVDKDHVNLSFPDFNDFVTSYDLYSIGETIHTFDSKPPSLQCDMIFRYGFIPLCIFIFGVHYLAWFGPASTL